MLHCRKLAATTGHPVLHCRNENGNVGDHDNLPRWQRGGDPPPKGEIFTSCRRDSIASATTACSPAIAPPTSRARQLLAMPSRPKEPETPEATLNGPRVLPRPCPCCGGRMIIIETFARGCEPSPTPVPAAIRIDTS